MEIVIKFLLVSHRDEKTVNQRAYRQKVTREEPKVKKGKKFGQSVSVSRLDVEEASILLQMSICNKT